MKAVIMAGGHGTRARPFTDYFPKAMMPVAGTPIIQYIIQHLNRSDAISGITIIANLKKHGAQIRHRYAAYGKKPITFVQDSDSGTGGDLRHADLRGDFVLWFSDNLCPLNITDMASWHRRSGAQACVAVRSRRPEETGFADVRDGIIERFREKPTLRLPAAECLGIYILGDDILDRIRQRDGPVNLSYDILQDMPHGSVAAYDIGDTPWLDAESPAALDRNAKLARRITSQMAGCGSPHTRI